MWCMRCNNDIIDCTCPDIEERLKSLGNTNVAPAAMQNWAARKIHQERIVRRLLEDPIEPKP